MSKTASKSLPPDQAQRERALDPRSSVLVQAPAGSGKTDLLTRRFLCLLAEVEDPARIVAITFTKAAAAEMRQRILAILERASAATNAAPAAAPDSMEALAHRALDRAQELGWNLLDQPAQLRISTIDSFCRELALRQPLLSGLGGGLDIDEHPRELYLRAARRTLEAIDGPDSALRTAIEALLVWRDNDWQGMEGLLVEMLADRDRWMHGFVLESEPNWDALRQRLERPFANAVREALDQLGRLLDQVPEARDESLKLARFACEHGAGEQLQALAELVDFPCIDFESGGAGALDGLEQSREAYLCLGRLLLTGGRFRKLVDRRHGFPADRKGEKARLLQLIARLSAIDGLESALANVGNLPPARYTGDDWQIVRACFTLLRHAAGQLKVVFAEAGAVDYIEVAQIALNLLRGSDGLPTDAALALADGIRHILVDEFQDTSRRQHELLRRLIAAWPEREGRSCFVVGDPMQSIYFFRDADAELFPRVRDLGFEISNAEPLRFRPVALTANFRTARPLLEELNRIFANVFAANDGSGVGFSPAQPAREGSPSAGTIFQLHLDFTAPAPRGRLTAPDESDPKQDARSAQIAQIVQLVRGHMDRIEQARATGDKYRVAVLGRARSALAPIAQALREAAIPFRAVDLERLSARPEVLDALALARALLNPMDRTAWLGVLRAPWCGLSLADLHTLASADNPQLLVRPVPELLAERLQLLSGDGRLAAGRVLDALAAAPSLRFGQPASTPGTWLQQVWMRLGGRRCVDPAARGNLELLWQCLDALPNGEPDLLGPALSSALDSLTAQPDPSVSSDCGIQLMTIHKAKGLEFEVVVVPELQAASGKGKARLLSWLERGVSPEQTADRRNESEEITEFLVAPLQPKGEDRGKAKAWVDRVYRERETQEMRRILYVAATRAREELHLFARMQCKENKEGALAVAEPLGSLLATAWPALGAEAVRRFEAWRADFTEAQPAILESVAASGESNLLQMPASLRPTLLRRLPPDYRVAHARSRCGGAETADRGGSGRGPALPAARRRPALARAGNPGSLAS